ncbi:sugar nucleotide-binding protein [Candidatus Woesearchaeota archaeon]|nr:sugar nucleotide-binding protein [Candidatus Woesearchaeota archaeon]
MKYGKVLLTGGSGTLGGHILKSGLFKNIIAPSSAELDITNAAAVEKFFEENDFDAVIHCAALARISECEKEPEKAMLINAVGTSNLVVAAIKKEAETGRKTRFIHISTDGVYQSTKGDYSETDEAMPYNRYGWAKLAAEASVNVLANFCIIRTRFLDTKNIKYDAYATDSYTSIIPVDELVKAIAIMADSEFVGTINVGGQKVSDYDAYKRYKPTIKPCKFEDIQGKTPFKLSKDASMNVSLWKKIQKQAGAEK